MPVTPGICRILLRVTASRSPYQRKVISIASPGLLPSGGDREDELRGDARDGRIIALVEKVARHELAADPDRHGAGAKEVADVVQRHAAGGNELEIGKGSAQRAEARSPTDPVAPEHLHQLP